MANNNRNFKEQQNQGNNRHFSEIIADAPLGMNILGIAGAGLDLFPKMRNFIQYG